MPFRIYALGSNSSGQLGVGHSEDASKPHPCIILPSESGDELEEIIKVVGGGSHTLVLSSRGRVWASGNNGDGRCSLCSTLQQLENFHHIDMSTLIQDGAGTVTDIIATWEASIFVVNKQKVFTSGSGSKGELGQGPLMTRSKQPQEIVIPKGFATQDAKLVEVVAGVNHVLLMTSDGELLGWGSSRKGQLGEEAKGDKIVWTPRKISIPFRARKVIAGRDFTYIIGQGDEQLFLGDTKHFVNGVDLAVGVDDSATACGWSNIYHQSGSGLHGLGRNDRGQLPPEKLPGLTGFAAGSEHCVASTDDSKIIAWGWGEHGNCGEPIDEKGNVVRRYNTIPIPLESSEAVSMVAAGCATTFIVLCRQER